MRSSLTSGNNRLLQSVSSLQNTNYRWYFIGVNCSFLSMQMLILARGWLVYEMTDSPLLLGITSGVIGIPLLLATPFGGVLADKLNKKRLIVFTELISTVFTLILAILILTNTIQIWHIVVNSFIAGLAASVNMPARQAIIADLVGEKHLVNAITLNSIGLNVSRILGPALAGVLAALFDVGIVYLVTSILYIGVVGSLTMISYHPTKVSFSTVTPLKDLSEGWSYTIKHPTMLGQIFIGCAICIFGLPYMTLMPVYAKDIFHGGVSDLGVLTTSSAIGFLIGSLGLALVGDFKRKGMVLLVSVALFGMAILSFALSNNYLLSCLLLAAIGIANSLGLILNQTIIQTTCDPEMRGRVLALFMTTWGLQSLAAFPIGALAQTVGAPWTMASSGILLTVSALLLMLLMPKLKS
jgi:MFS family permease